MPAEEHLQYVPESPAVELRVVTWGAIAALILLGGTIGGLHWIYQDAVPIQTMPKPQIFPQPRVVTHAADKAELHQLAAEQGERLNGWGWADARHTFIRVPIDRAMRLLAQKGGKAWEPLMPAQPTLSSPTARAEVTMTPSAPANSTASPPENQP